MSAPHVILWLVVAYLVVVEPLLGKRLYQRLKAGRWSRLSFYRTTIVWEWALVAFVIIVYLFGGISLRLLGLYNPNGVFFPSGLLSGVIGGIIIGTLAVTLSSRFRGRSRKASRRERSIGEFDAILPRTRDERWMFAGVAVTAGICEEILYRGLMVYVLNHQFPDIGPLLTVVVTAVLFALAHYYQGASGMLATGLLGVIFTAIFLSTGALWIAMVIHALIDLRVLLLKPQEV